MRFRQQPCTTRRIIAVDLRIGYSLCPMRPARGYTSSSFAQERSVNRLEAASQPVRGRGLEMSVIGLTHLNLEFSCAKIFCRIETCVSRSSFRELDATVVRLPLRQLIMQTSLSVLVSLRAIRRDAGIAVCGWDCQPCGAFCGAENTCRRGSLQLRPCHPR